MDLDAAYRTCGRIARERAKNFYYSFLFLPAAMRRALCALYAFCRRADDLSDDGLPPDRVKAGLDDLRRQLRAPSSPEMTALADARARFRIPDAPFEEILLGVEMDLSKRRYATFDELRLYCSRVASAVGLASIEIFGYDDPAARDAAVDLGIAMQLTNILRDLKEDAERDRVYLPQDELARFGVAEDRILRGTPAFPDLMRFQVARARDYFARGGRVVPKIRRRARSCPAILAAMYGAVLDEIEARGYDVYGKRVTLTTPRKWRIAGATLLATLLGRRSA